MNRLYYGLMLHAPMSFNRFLWEHWTSFRAWWGPW
jgi:hypothetical protein